MTQPLHFISSMATRQVLADLAARYESGRSERIRVESVGGVDAARRVAAGEAFDGVVLASDAIDKLIASGHVLAGSRVDLVRSGVAVAVPVGAPVPDIGSEAALRHAVLAARRIGYSTGPSGTALLQLFQRWGVAAEVQPRCLQAPPGVPVGRLVAEGQVDLGFQQLAELMNLKGITLLGLLPPEVAIVTTFSGGVAATSQRPHAVRAALSFMSAPGVHDIKRANGLQGMQDSPGVPGMENA